MADRGMVASVTHASADGGAATLPQVLDNRARRGQLSEELRDGAVRCLARAHRRLPRPERGICKVSRMTDADGTSPETRLRACAIGARGGLKLLHAGNPRGASAGGRIPAARIA
jgi:hypothetical protein